jgi:hypothetical protein
VTVSDSLIAGGLRKEILEGDLACCIVRNGSYDVVQRCINLSTSTKVVSKTKQVVWITKSGTVVRAPSGAPMYVMSEEDAIKWFINQKAPGGGDLLHKAPYDLMRKALLE